jgi:hypothetical protein
VLAAITLADERDWMSRAEMDHPEVC